MNTHGKFQTDRLLGPLVLLVMAILLSGCGLMTFAVPLKPTVDHLPSASKIPLSVSIYYSPELRSYKYEFGSQVWCNLRRPLYVLPIGQASVTLFERLFSVMFHNTVTLESLPPAKPNLSVIIEPDIENVECEWPDGSKPIIFQITYHFTLYSPTGEALAYWNVTGRGESTGGIFTNRDTKMGNAAELAMEDAARKIATQLRDIPAVARLLHEEKATP